MKATFVTLTDNYSDRSLRLRFMRDLSKYDSLKEYFSENEKWTWLTDGQRKKIEDFFGKVNAYYTTISFDE